MNSRVSLLLDATGVVAIATAAAALGGVFWFGPRVAEAIWFGIFHVALAIAVGSFIVNRLIDVIHLVATTPDPKRLRAAGDVPVEARATDQVADARFRKAA